MAPIITTTERFTITTTTERHWWGDTQGQDYQVTRITRNDGGHLVGTVVVNPDGEILASTCMCERNFPLTRKVSNVEEGIRVISDIS